MRTTTLSLPELGLVGMTRGMLGVGIGLLLANRLDREQRRAVGLTLAGVGLATTIPLALMVFAKRRSAIEEPIEEAPEKPAISRQPVSASRP